MSFSRYATDTGEEWILAVRQQVTKSDPDITVGEIVQIFNAESAQMDLLLKQFREGRTPKQAYMALRKAFGKRLGATRYDTNGKPV